MTTRAVRARGARRSRRTEVAAAVVAAAAVVGVASVQQESRADAPPDPTIAFSDVTQAAGVAWTGNSWGAAWADVDGDGWMDLYRTNHRSPDTIHLNDGDGTFTARPDLAPAPNIDTHGAAWGDVDNDGDADLFVSVGSGGLLEDPNIFLVNEGGTFVERAVEYGLDYPLSDSRAPLWLDADADGLLDLFLPASLRSNGLPESPSAVFDRHADTGLFGVSTADLLGAPLPGASHFGMLADLTGDGRLDLSTQTGNYNFPSFVFDLSAQPAVDRRAELGIPAVYPARDAAIGDFDNDLDNDVFLVRGAPSNGVSVELEGVELSARLDPRGDRKAVTFTAPGRIYLRMRPAYKLTQFGLHNIYVGASAWNPTGVNLTLDPANPAHQGLPPYLGPDTNAIYIGYDTANRRWEIAMAGTSTWQQFFVRPLWGRIGNVEEYGLDGRAKADLYYRRDEAGFVEATVASGLSGLTYDTNVAPGDFDNDGDLDLFVVATTSAGNRPDKLLENLGGGRFRAIDAGPAAGLQMGQGCTVTLVDYDRDGRLDVFVTNGRKLGVGPDQLFRNTTENANHWLQLRLVGTASNRDAIGARVEVRAGDLQVLREQTGGFHERGAQSSPLLHVGLGAHQQADVTITWPSGQVQTLTGVAADQELEVVEPTP